MNLLKKQCERGAPALNWSRFAGAVFDLDGTLVDSMGVWEEIDRSFFAKHGLVQPDDYSRAISSLGYDEAAAYTRRRFGLAESEEEIVAEWHAAAVEQYARHIGPMPGAVEFVRSLREWGMRLSLATASDRALYEPVLRRTGMYGAFDAFTTLGEVDGSKEKPDIYLRAAGKIGLEPARCIVFEDIPCAVRAAKLAGMTVIAVCGPGGCGGAAAQAADGCVCDFRQLLPTAR